jgi:coenzyme F420-0:L-glutamate ligase/coenzyme F420-1:gamma-L-glutamate ligase
MPDSWKLMEAIAGTASRRIEVIGLGGIPEIRPGDDLAALTLDACDREEIEPADGDVFVFTQKVVSKSEGRIVSLTGVEPSALALRFGEESGRDPRLVELVLQEARRVVRMDRGILVTETRHGLVCANSGVDASNVEEEDAVCLLPEDSDLSAERIRTALTERAGKSLAVLVTDTFGRPWREGQVNVAIGIAGMEPIHDHRGLVDPRGRKLLVSEIAVADEIAGAAELVMGKLERVPVALVRGYPFEPGDGGIRRLLRAREQDLFR